MPAYLHGLLVACDQLLNALLGGWPDETLSSRCWRWHVAGVRSWPCRCLDRLAALFGDREHCRQSYESERTGRQMPPELR
ncbi:pseudouridine synthase [Desulfovibrio sp.]|uniref:pseudouridine synthase n=1 Tax=Desulfovibrio sp. TaxID=885 RepID=UPI003AAAD437